MIDLLLPTYGRAGYLEKNLLHLSSLVQNEGLVGQCRILVSDDASPDETWSVIERFRGQTDLIVEAYRQEKNLGLDGNTVFLLEHATAEYILFVGEDDFLPAGYLGFCADTVTRDPSTAAILPGIVSHRLDGRRRVARQERFDVKRFSAGKPAAWSVGYLGYQMTGLFLKREGLAALYTADPALRNLHLFNTFVLYNTMRGTSYYAPKFQVEVTTGNKKHWQYDNIGLLGDIYKNFQIVFPGQKRWQNKLFLRAISKQKWKIGVHHDVWINPDILRSLAQSVPMDFDLRLRLFLFHFGTLLNVPWYHLDQFFFRFRRRSQTMRGHTE